jgi:formate hydrogenlyase subunit 3/multisubunit Na+/H+ antiporter MnhD subunit
MPSNTAQWIWFIFFIVGTVGGWAFIGTLIYRFNREGTGND